MKSIQIKEKSTSSKIRKWYLNFEERKMIEKMLNEWISKRQIASILERWKSTICEEVKNRSTTHSGYSAELAHRQFLKNSLKKGNKKKIENNEKLKNYIISWLKQDWSPEEIAGRMKLLHWNPNFDDYIPSVCHETIYTYLYSPENKNEKLFLYLRRHRPKRRKQGSRKKRTVENTIKNRVPIHERPKIIEKRKRIWDFESDSVLFSKQKKVLNTNICRVSKLARLELVKNKSADACIKVQKSIIYEMEELGVDIYSFTFDNGTENARHIELNELWVQTYFCDPYSSWQKGSIENLNMFIRQYLPRNIDIWTITDNDIYNIQERLNNRPRKCLGYLTPNEFFYKKTWVKPN